MIIASVLLRLYLIRAIQRPLKTTFPTSDHTHEIRRFLKAEIKYIIRSYIFLPINTFVRRLSLRVFDVFVEQQPQIHVIVTVPLKWHP